MFCVSVPVERIYAMNGKEKKMDFHSTWKKKSVDLKPAKSRACVVSSVPLRPHPHRKKSYDFYELKRLNSRLVTSRCHSLNLICLSLMVNHLRSGGRSDEFKFTFLSSDESISCFFPPDGKESQTMLLMMSMI